MESLHPPDMARAALRRRGMENGVVYFGRGERGRSYLYVEGSGGYPISTPEQRAGHVYPEHTWTTDFWVIVE